MKHQALVIEALEDWRDRSHEYKLKFNMYKFYSYSESCGSPIGFLAIDARFTRLGFKVGSAMRLEEHLKMFSEDVPSYKTFVREEAIEKFFELSSEEVRNIFSIDGYPPGLSLQDVIIKIKNMSGSTMLNINPKESSDVNLTKQNKQLFKDLLKRETRYKAFRAYFRFHIHFPRRYFAIYMTPYQALLGAICMLAFSFAVGYLILG